MIAMHNTSIESFYAAAASVAGALIGLLFVAVSVAHERRRKDDAASGHQIPATAALTAFTNALVISLFGLIENGQIATAAAACGAGGILYVGGGLMSLSRSRQFAGHNLFILGLMLATFVGEIITGLTHTGDPASLDVQKTVAILVVLCFLTGITRSWELIGGQQIGVISELTGLLRRRLPPARTVAASAGAVSASKSGQSSAGDRGSNTTTATSVSWKR